MISLVQQNLRRGDYSPCGKFRFWAYQKRTNKTTGRRGERWIPTERYEEERRRTNDLKQLNAAAREWRLMNRTRTEVAA